MTLLEALSMARNCSNEAIENFAHAVSDKISNNKEIPIDVKNKLHDLLVKTVEEQKGENN